MNDKQVDEQQYYFSYSSMPDQLNESNLDNTRNNEEIDERISTPNIFHIKSHEDIKTSINELAGVSYQYISTSAVDDSAFSSAATTTITQIDATAQNYTHSQLIDPNGNDNDYQQQQQSVVQLSSAGFDLKDFENFQSLQFHGKEEEEEEEEEQQEVEKSMTLIGSDIVMNNMSENNTKILEMDPNENNNEHLQFLNYQSTNNEGNDFFEENNEMFQNYDAIPSENNINLDNFTSHQHIDAKSADILLANVAQRQQNGGDASQYKINYDPNPTIIHRENTEDITYKQEVAVRYLQPPTPPIPGPIIIKEIRPPQPPAAPPVIIRQRPPPPQTPPPIIVREAPPPIPETPGPKIITKSLPAPPPPPRRVVIERLPALPPKPRSVIIERWLPYKMPKRRVIYQKADLSKATLNDKVRNLIIQWQGPKSHVVKEVKNLGVVKVNPQQYLQKYANEVKTFQNMQNTLKQYELDLNNDKLAPDSISTFEQQQQEQQQQQSILSNHQQEFNSIFSLNQDEFEEMKQNEEIHESLDPMFNHINTNEINTIINEPIASINFTDESPSTTDDMNLQLTDPNLFNDDKDLLLSNKIIDQSDQQDYGKERDQWI